MCDLLLSAHTRSFDEAEVPEQRVKQPQSCGEQRCACPPTSLSPVWGCARVCVAAEVTVPPGTDGLTWGCRGTGTQPCAFFRGYNNNPGFLLSAAA